MTRETAIALLNNLRAFAEDDDEPAIDMAIEALSERTGEWEQTIADGVDGSHWYEYECSHCGYVELRPMNFCPNCGAKMNKGGDDK